MNHKIDHVWHIWINQEADLLRTWERHNPTGETATETRRGKPVETPTKPRTPLELIDPHERGLYNFKAAVGLLPWLTRMIGLERTNAMPLEHQQCLHAAPEPIPENILTCGLGKKLSECPILARLRATFDQERGRKRPDGGDSFYAEITDEQVDNVAAMTCVWHMLMGSDGFVDWQEGAVQTTSDQMYWERLYKNLSQPIPDEPSDAE